MPKTSDTSHLRGWKIITEDFDPANSKYFESIFTLGNGYLGVRGSLEEAVTDPHNEPMTLIAEVYDDPGVDDKPERLAPAPNWLRISFDDGSGPLSVAGSTVLSQVRTLSMRRGTLTRHARFQGGDGRITSIISTRLVSMARPHLAAITYSVIPENYSGRVKLTSMIDGVVTYGDGFVQTEEVSKSSNGNTISYVARTRQSGIDIAEAARHYLIGETGKVEADVTVREPDNGIALDFAFSVEMGKLYSLEKVVAIDTSFREPDPLASVLRMAKSAPRFGTLQREHAAVWRDYWKDCEIRIVGDPLVQTMAHFWVFQLLQAASKNNVSLGLSASIPAKTMSGPGYNGHIFWDTEIYMLPFFSQQYPEIAESLLDYRYDRMDTAMRNAVAEDCRGARFPWESASSGVDTTPKWCATGWREIHVVSDVAFAVWQHYLTTGDEAYLYGHGLEIILETARYWSTRAERVDIPGGHRYEISEVIGPDEFHDPVDNSVFTNAMARWNIRKAMELLGELEKTQPQLHAEVVARHGITADELEQWRDVADNIKINLDSETGLYEEFDGYFELEGDARNIKQADVLLMLHLLPELRTTDIFRRNFDVYYPVTVHGSSLSPAVHVLFALDIGYRDHAYRYEVQSCRIDGAVNGGTGAGLHAASLGGGWSSIVAGFGGVRVMPDCLSVAPDPPEKWKLLEFSIRYKNARLRFRIERRSLSVTSDSEGSPVDLNIRGKRTRIRPGETVHSVCLATDE